MQTNFRSFVLSFVCFGAKLCMFRCYAMWEYKRIRLRVRIRIGVPSVLLPIPLQNNVQVHFESICFYSGIFLVASFSSCFPLLFPKWWRGTVEIYPCMYMYMYMYLLLVVCYFLCVVYKKTFAVSYARQVWLLMECVSLRVCVRSLCVELYYFFVAYPFSWGLFLSIFP